MKFIRWAQWRIEQTGAGILGFITRNTYLDGITHWRMRESLMKTFSEIYILDLHGSLRAKEKTRTVTLDKNVFDIQWGVSIGLFIKDAQSAAATKVRHADLWGEREDKYDYLSRGSVGTTKWTKVKPTAPNFYLHAFRTPKAKLSTSTLRRFWTFSNSRIPGCRPKRIR